MQFDAFEEARERLGLGTAGKPALVGIVVVLLMVTVLAAGRLIGTVTAKEFQVVPEASAVSESSGEPVEGAGTSGGADARQATVFVHVSGAVASPGLVELDGGARVADAVQAAGGFAEDADVGSVNLARLLQDGEQVHVRSQDEQPSGGDGASMRAEAEVTTSGATASRVNINQASEAELVTLPGIGPSTAAKIVADRQANGSFGTVEDLKRVPGIGDKKLESLRDLICV